MAESKLAWHTKALLSRSAVRAVTEQLWQEYEAFATREERRRTKVMPHAFGERPLLKLMFAAAIRASDKWRAIRVTAFDRQQTGSDPKGAGRGLQAAEQIRRAGFRPFTNLQHNWDLTPKTQP